MKEEEEVEEQGQGRRKGYLRREKDRENMQKTLKERKKLRKECYEEGVC